MDINEKQLSEYASKVMELARDAITIQYRFFDGALAKYKFMENPGSGCYRANGEVLYYDPEKLLKDYVEEPNYPVRLLLHVLFHGIFLHSYRFDKTNEYNWNMACDIAVENVVLSLNWPEAALLRDNEQRIRIEKIKKWVPSVTADPLYREFCVSGMSIEAEAEYKRLFTFDLHMPRITYKEEPQTIITKEDWQRIAERVKAELKSFSKNVTGSETIKSNLNEATKTRYDYDSILKAFAVRGEEIKVNPDEFDYIYYTYGLRTYGKLPLIEPLEYTENKKIRDFVIAVDTSASCSGEVVKSFMQKTYEILSAENSFFKEVNIHIIQCDATIQSDTVIKNRDQFDEFLREFTVKGFGATDFRPVFAYVDELIYNREFDDLQGLVYLTDGYGIYPEKAPKYDVIFAFLDEDENRVPVPPWSIKVILESEDVLQEK
ncbi:MAG: VWA-like domain-containing protein [Acetatifactor sp.]|nr:VWA-like domain-containing protein [Acetatifactor sp.]